ncbi:MAG: ABC transporter permease [Candidatus Thermoplasmatota archaeon]|nr:ABC transporter permease [Candidatus Thermoplasmatota archaeon]
MKKEIRVTLRYPVNFACSLAMIFVFAALLGSVGAIFFSGGQMIGLALSGLIMMEAFSDSLWGVGFSLSAERYQGTLESFYLTPANRFSSIAARFGITFFWTPITILLCLLLMRAYGISYDLSALLILLPLFSMLLGLGCALAGLCLLYRQTGQLLINVTQFSLMILCAFFFPFSSLPQPLLWLSRAVPFSYGIDAFRATLLNTPTELLGIRAEILLLLIFGIIVPVAGYYVYKIAERRVLEEGGLRVY